MPIYVSPTERAPYNTLGEGSYSLTEGYGCDFSIVNAEDKVLGIQRKRFPEDLASSIRDGRLANQMSLMGGCDLAVFVFEGRPSFNRDGKLVMARGSRGWGNSKPASEFHQFLTREVVAKVQLNIMARGFGVVWVDTPLDFVTLVEDWQAWWHKPSADHKLGDLKPPTLESRAKATPNELRQARMAQALRVVPGVGSKVAESIVRYGGLKLTVSPDLLQSIEGLGPKTVKALVKQFGSHEP